MEAKAGAAVRRGVTVGASVGRGVTVDTSVGRGVTVGAGVDRGVTIGAVVGRGATAGADVGCGVGVGRSVAVGSGSVWQAAENSNKIAAAITAANATIIDQRTFNPGTGRSVCILRFLLSTFACCALDSVSAGGCVAGLVVISLIAASWLWGRWRALYLNAPSYRIMDAPRESARFPITGVRPALL